MEAKSNGSLAIGEDPEFQRRSWAIQRVGWAVMAALLVAGMLGILGGAGPFVDATAGGQEYGITVDYQQYIRKRAPTNLRLHILPGAVDSTEVNISIDRVFLERFEIVYINPEPSQIAAGDSVMTYTFLLSNPNEETTVTFNIQAERFGKATGHIGLQDLPPVEISQITYP
jgi:hypothetical protein